ncbi:MAG: endolytic transglycosylase MltG [Candidatus Staskawiczbacteria bacterium]|jgi:UPF0755 protein
MKKRDLSKISIKFFEKISSTVITILVLIVIFIILQIYLPINPTSHENIVFTVEKGWSDDQIASKLEELKIIRSSLFFQFYAIVSLKHSSLQAGEYNISPKMSTYTIVNKMAKGDVIKDKVVILEGWNIKDIAEYLELKEICKKEYFTSLTKIDYSAQFNFLKDAPKKAGIEGYIFPDTYQIAKGESCEDIIDITLKNFDKKLTPELRVEIIKQKKTIFDIIIMASMIEKEVRTTEDKKIVSGILWKRLSVGMPLQLDATVNYITGKNDPGAKIKDTKIDSPYNTYKYAGLPKGPISSPGINSIMAAIYPKKTSYWYYMTDGVTIFSETFAQHKAAIANYKASK